MDKLIVDTNYFFEDISISDVENYQITPTHLNQWEILNSTLMDPESSNYNLLKFEKGIKKFIENIEFVETLHPLGYLLNSKAKEELSKIQVHNFEQFNKILESCLNNGDNIKHIEFSRQERISRTDMASLLTGWLDWYVKKYNRNQRFEHLENPSEMHMNVKDILTLLAENLLIRKFEILRDYKINGKIVSDEIDWTPFNFTLHIFSEYLKRKLEQNVDNISPTAIKGNDVYDIFHTLYVNDPSIKFFTDEGKWGRMIKKIGLTQHWVPGIR